MKFLRISLSNVLPSKLIRLGVSVSLPLVVLLGAAVLLRASFSTANAGESKKTSSSMPLSSPRPLARLSSGATARFENAGNRLVNLSDARDLVTSYEGTPEAILALESHGTTALAATSDDFDEDGVPDMVCGYASSNGGMLTLHRGNVDSVYSNAPEALQRRAQGKFTDAPFLAPARVFDSPEAPELVGAGDFDADDHSDVITARVGSNALLFYAGDGRGRLAKPRRFMLPGEVTALEVGEINRRDGLADIVLGITSATGPKVLVFESPLGAINAKPEEFDLPAPAASLALGEIVGGYEQDLAIAAGNRLIVLAGRDRKLSFDARDQPPVKQPKICSLSFSCNLQSLVIGNFSGDNHTDIAILCDDGRVRISRSPAITSSNRRNSSLAGWLIEAVETDRWPMASKIVRARVSSNPTESLLVLDSKRW